MAEILLSLTIIGVVAAITLPSLTGNINERTWNTQRKALYARMSQAISLMPALNGYGQYQGTNTDGVVTTTIDTATETFITAGLSKVLKINNICNDNFGDCGIVSTYTNMKGSKLTTPKKLSELNKMFTEVQSRNDGYFFQNPQNDIDTKAVAFETQNGESIVTFYNPRCVVESLANSYSQLKMCANFIYDLNGKKGPNTVGKDIGFISAIYPSDPVVVAPMPIAQDVSQRKTQREAGKACTDMDAESRLPNLEELNSMFYNRDLIELVETGYWSSSVATNNKAWEMGFDNGHYFKNDRDTTTRNVRCVKR